MKLVTNVMRLKANFRGIGNMTQMIGNMTRMIIEMMLKIENMMLMIRNLKRMMVFSTREQPRPQQSCQQGRANWSGRPNKQKFEYLDIFQIICNRII